MDRRVTLKMILVETVDKKQAFLILTSLDSYNITNGGEIRERCFGQLGEQTHHRHSSV